VHKNVFGVQSELLPEPVGWAISHTLTNTGDIITLLIK
jgi:hypothetical protein